MPPSRRSTGHFPCPYCASAYVLEGDVAQHLLVVHPNQMSGDQIHWTADALSRAAEMGDEYLPVAPPPIPLPP